MRENCHHDHLAKILRKHLFPNPGLQLGRPFPLLTAGRLLGGSLLPVGRLWKLTLHPPQLLLPGPASALPRPLHSHPCAEHRPAGPRAELPPGLGGARHRRRRSRLVPGASPSSVLGRPVGLWEWKLYCTRLCFKNIFSLYN